VKTAILALFTACALLSPACAATPAPEAAPLAPGSTLDRSLDGAPKTVTDTKIASFKAEFRHEGGYMIRKGDKWEPDREKNARRPHGFYRFTAVRESRGAKIAAEFPGDEKYEFTAPLSALDELHTALIANDLPQINGFDRWNSALGVYFWVSVRYSSGEKIEAYGEGGAACSSPVDLGFLIDTFRALAEKYAPLANLN